mgnify:CR=1 FL=1
MMKCINKDNIKQCGWTKMQTYMNKMQTCIKYIEINLRKIYPENSLSQRHFHLLDDIFAASIRSGFAGTDTAPIPVQTLYSSNRYTLQNQQFAIDFLF